MTQAEIAEHLTKSYKEGRFIREIGQEVGLSFEKARRILVENGVQIRKRGQLPIDLKHRGNAQEIVRMYQADVTSTEIADKLGINYGSVLRILRNNGVKIKEQGDYLSLDSKRGREVIESYQRTGEAKLTSQEVGVSIGTVRQLATEAGIYKRIPTNWKYRGTNGHYFDQLDCFDKLYFLGLIFADGNNDEERNSVSLVLQERDRYIQEKLALGIRGEIGHLKTVKRAKSHHQLRFGVSFRNVALSKRLAELGCVHDKTFKLRFPDHLSDEQFASFLLGLFDGDGHVGVYYPKGKEYSATCAYEIVGTEHLIRGVAAKLESLLQIKSRVNKRVGCYSVRFSPRIDMLKIYDFMYRNARFGMVRKHDKFVELFEHHGISHTNWWRQNKMADNLGGTSFLTLQPQ